MDISPENELPSALLDWFEGVRRDLPWRRTTDPYRILVSEIMLQQTRVETVLRYYDGFLERFPDVESLAEADAEEVVAAWSGLGYYRRARRLHACARAIVERGDFPGTLVGWLELPGIGAYTAAAVGSIAFGLVEPVLDGNVERVLSRLLALEEEVHRRSARAAMLEAGRALLDPTAPGDSNQALMELGALVCRPRSPECDLCPLASGCRALASSQQERYPRKKARSAPRRRRRLVVVAEHRGRVLLYRRARGDELLAGMVELPSVETEPLDEPVDRLQAERLLETSYGSSWTLEGEPARVRHGITTRSFVFDVWRATVDEATLSSIAEAEPGWRAARSEAIWCTPDELSRLGVPSWVRKCLEVTRIPDGDRS